MLQKKSIDELVAFELGLPVRTVARITKLFLDRVCLALVEDGEVNLHTFGFLRVRITSQPNRCTLGDSTQPPQRKVGIYVRFNKGALLTRMLRKAYSERDMEKYGVAEDALPGENKEAAAELTCPHCGKVCEQHGRVLICPGCGSTPFEGEASGSEGDADGDPC